MRTITLITTGGTLEKVYDETTGTLVNRHSNVAHILQGLRLEDTRINIHELLNKDSLDMTDVDRALIVETVRNECDNPGIDGVIVLHGTDTLSETGERLFADIKNPRVPIVLTGAMRPYELKQSDALQNLTESIFAVGVLDPGVYAVVHGRSLKFPGVVKDRTRGTFDSGEQLANE
ncbi:MAG: asparaginase [Phycisphaera sp.]|nr:MAG: asparaginase [Phycisphaera sp.]